MFTLAAYSLQPVRRSINAARKRILRAGIYLILLFGLGLHVFLS